LKLKNFQWIGALFNRGNSRKRNNGMMMWISVLSVVGAVFFSFRKNRGGNMLRLIQDFMSRGQNPMQKVVPAVNSTNKK
jgi:UPF0716 family protein affecting phage T7 exclusion